MAVVYGKGAPDKVFPEFMPALYGSVYTLKFGLKKKGLPTLFPRTNGFTLSVCLFLKTQLPCPRKSPVLRSRLRPGNMAR